MVKNLSANVGDASLIPGAGRSPGDPPPRNFHEQRSLAGYSPWGHERVRHNSTTKQHKPLFKGVSLQCCTRETQDILLMEFMV